MAVSQEDRQMLLLATRSAGGFHLATQWFLRDWAPLPYQWAWHQKEALNTTVIAGIASGKTTIASASYLIDCLSIPYFRALNASVTAKQAELAFNMVMSWIEGNPRLEQFVQHITLRPFPMITFSNFSEYEFRTAGIDARFIRGFEYDRINYDEAGLDLTGQAVRVLRGRLRGRRPNGTIRMARLDVMTSPAAAAWLKERYYRGIRSDTTYDPQYLSMKWSTWMNTMLTQEQVKAMEAEYPPDMIDVELGGNFPDFGMSMFPASHVDACTDASLYDAAYIALHPEEGSAKRGYELEEDARHGIVLYELPVEPGHIYISAGDPGIGNYPARNAPCVMVGDVTTKPHKLVYFWWGAGKGSFNPFLSHYRKVIDKYSPFLRGIDATGPQKYVDEIAFENHGIETSKLNFSSDKIGMLNNLSVDITDHNWQWPPIKGMIRQLNTYLPEEDTPAKKIPQDTIMTLSQISYLSRFLPPEPEKGAQTARDNYTDRRQRTNVRQGR